MSTFIKPVVLLAVTLAIISCQSTGTEQSTPDLKEILPNTTWYGSVPDSSEIYTKWKYGNLNTEIVYSIHNFPCGSTPNHTLTGNYTILDNNKLRLEFIYIYPRSTSEHEVVSYSEGTIVMKGVDDNSQITIYSNCNDTK
ncbi:hypothetical protein [Fodinibius sp.]|uniref:hypothetical protein n=1 Tax=Fodinibius sp. TaxID=1872440 RepID=UPI002ACEDD22|nr:hypothetical protein [Fodinibius sp.]MDZ7660678.1 hypothetical protein [Fodinibius sp.]